MIARTVHEHTPENEFDREKDNIFNKFLSSRKKIGKKLRYLMLMKHLLCLIMKN